MTRRRLALACLCVALLCIFFSSAGMAAPKTELAPRYDHWLHAEVNYLISDEEQRLFLGLKTDEERDRFIDNFWKVRNPDPNSPVNEAKQTLYQRLAYVNAHFGYGNTQDGWRSDRGMVYITLGAPQQIEKYPETRELRPLQIWFYQNLSGALPVHFYVVFYKQSPAEDYELYSPYGDRPQKLINSTNAVNDDRTAIKIIRDNIDDEAGHIALSLIPGEPVDFSQPYPSLQSDVLLNNIRNYRNLPQIRELVAERRANAETVSHRVVLGEEFSNLAVVATRDADGQPSLQYLFRLLRPADFALAEQTSGSYFYSLRLETKLTDARGMVVSDKTQALSDLVPEKMFHAIANKCFGLEGRIPVQPGSYQLSLVLTNTANSQAFRQTSTVVVPGAEDRIGISRVFFADAFPPQASTSSAAPFSFGGVRLRPIGSDNTAVTQGQPLRAIFQIWMAKGVPSELTGKTLAIHYTIGQVSGNGGARVEQDQQVDRGSFSPEGNLLVGRDFRTDSLVPGAYRLIVRVSDTASGAVAFQSLNFSVEDAGHPVASLWTVDAPAVR